MRPKYLCRYLLQKFEKWHCVLIEKWLHKFKHFAHGSFRTLSNFLRSFLTPVSKALGESRHSKFWKKTPLCFRHRGVVIPRCCQQRRLPHALDTRESFWNSNNFMKIQKNSKWSYWGIHNVIMGQREAVWCTKTEIENLVRLSL